MTGTTRAAREQFEARFAEYRNQTEHLIKHHESLKAAIAADAGRTGQARLELAASMLDLASTYVLRNRLSERFLQRADSHLLDGARSTCDRCVSLLEEVVGNTIDAPLSELIERLDSIDDVPDEVRLSLVQKTGFTIQSVEEQHPDDSRWRWYFVDLESRFTVVARNLLNLRTLVAGLDPRVEGYESRMAHLAITKEQLSRSATRLREKYEKSNRQILDLKRAVLLLSALRRIHILLGESDDADSVKRRIDLWKVRATEVDRDRGPV